MLSLLFRYINELFSCLCSFFLLARSFGTENRPVENPIAPRDEVYEYIIFRATDIKDLIVQDPPGSTTQPSSSAKTLIDPAIIQVVR